MRRAIIITLKCTSIRSIVRVRRRSAISVIKNDVAKSIIDANAMVNVIIIDVIVSVNVNVMKPNNNIIMVIIIIIISTSMRI